MPLAKQQVESRECEETQWRTPVLHLNHFQQMMLGWEDIHPYNAVHAIRLGGRAEMSSFQQAVDGACRSAGIGELVVESKHRTYRYRSVRSVRVRQVSAGLDAEQTLRAVVQDEMNSPFPDRPHFPLRWIVVDDVARDAHFVVLAYHHVAADAYSVQALLGLVISKYLNLPTRSNGLGLHASMPSHPARFRRRSRRLDHARSLAHTTLQYFKLRSAHRMHEDRSGCSETKFVLQSMPTAMADRLRVFCKAEGAGLNDLFLAALATAIARQTPARRAHRRRRKIALATVLSQRKRTGLDLTDFFGVCLSDAAVLIDTPDTGVREVLAQVVPQMRRLKSVHGLSDPFSKLVLVKYVWPALRISNSLASYRKVFPLCAGVSTVSLDEPRLCNIMAPVQRYVRACPPGPAMPMLLSPTIAAGRLELGLVFRPSCLSDADARGLLGLLEELLCELVA